MKIKVLGVDPALANTGLVTATFDIFSEEIEIISLKLTKTEPGNSKVMRKCYEDFERALIISADFKRFREDCDFVFAEIPHGSQSSRSAISVGMLTGILACSDVPVIPVSASDVKNIVGDSKATKRQIIDLAYKMFPNASWLFKGKTNQLINDNEHLADAIFTIKAGIATQEFRRILTALRLNAKLNKKPLRKRM